MILLFDLDRTIINTNEFKKGLSAIFGISLKEFESHVDSFFRKKNIHYTPEAHIKILKKIGHIKTSAAEKLIGSSYQKFLKKFGEFLFPEAESTLALLHKNGHRLVLITLGEPKSQRKKVEATGLKKYFEKIIYESKDKTKNKFIKNLIKSGEEILIINDKASEALAIQKMLGKNAKIFLVKGPHSKNIEHKEKIYKDIRHLKKVI